MQNYQEYFKGKPYKEYFRAKKVTIMGLGLLGGAVNDARFLAECGAELTITDLKSEKELATSIKKLKKFKNIKYVLGRHDTEDFKDKDFILQPGNVSPDSIYLQEARKNNIPIHESESLFFACLPAGVKTIGVTGTRGKTTTATLICEILKLAFRKKVHLAGNIQGKSTLALLKEIQSGDIVIMELDSWCLHGLGEIKKSPQISVFTNFLSDHLNYYLKGSKDKTEAEQKYFTDKAQIYLNQKEDDYLICGEKVSSRIGQVRSQKIVVNKNSVPNPSADGWKIKIPGEHNLVNIACAVKAVEALFKLTKSVSEPWFTCKKAVENFGGVEGRLQFLKNYKGVKIYNDTTATTPDATVVALRSLSPTSHQNASRGKIKKIILILGGSDKGLDLSGLIKEIPKYCKSVILLSGTGSEKLQICPVVRNSDLFTTGIGSLREAVKKALDFCKKGDILLFSPAFASFGMFKNEYDRGEKFSRIIKALK